MRRASIDVGANSVRLMVLELGAGGVRVLEDRGLLTRLGDSIARCGRLEGTPLEATLAAVGEYAAAARALDAEPVCIATAGLRDAANSTEALAMLSRACGCPARMISGRAEAELSYLGARAGSARTSERCAVIDVGGGSTEVAWGGAALEGAVSRPVGARVLVRLVPVLGAEGALDEAALGEAARAASAILSEEWPSLPAGATLFGTGGTVTTVAAMLAGLTEYDPLRVNDVAVGAEELRALVGELAALPLSRRRERMLEPERADLIVAGGVIVSEALRLLGAECLLASVFGLRLGAVTEEGTLVLENEG